VASARREGSKSFSHELLDRVDLDSLPRDDALHLCVFSFQFFEPRQVARAHASVLRPPEANCVGVDVVMSNKFFHRCSASYSVRFGRSAILNRLFRMGGSPVCLHRRKSTVIPDSDLGPIPYKSSGPMFRTHGLNLRESIGKNERDELRLELRRVCVAMALRHSELPSPLQGKCPRSRVKITCYVRRRLLH